jgi:hypothetical protein
MEKSDNICCSSHLFIRVSTNLFWFVFPLFSPWTNLTIFVEQLFVRSCIYKSVLVCFSPLLPMDKSDNICCSSHLTKWLGFVVPTMYKTGWFFCSPHVQSKHGLFITPRSQIVLHLFFPYSFIHTFVLHFSKKTQLSIRVQKCNKKKTKKNII